MRVIVWKCKLEKCLFGKDPKDAISFSTFCLYCQNAEIEIIKNQKEIKKELGSNSEKKRRLKNDYL